MFRALDYKFCNTAKVLKQWSQKFVGSIRLQLAVAREVTLKLEQAQERRTLTADELQLRRELKYKCLGLASLAQTIARQRSRINFIAEGDANSKFFHLQACLRTRQNFIDTLSQDGHTIAAEQDKSQSIFEHFNSILGSIVARQHNLDFDALNIPRANLTGTDCCFSEEEIWAIVHDIPSDKAPGPDGFTGLFYKTAWPIIKRDIFDAFNALSLG